MSNIISPDFDSPQKILLIRLSSIGDIILTTPVVRQLRERFPNAQIDYLVRREYAELLRFTPHLTHLLEIDVREPGALSAMKQRLRQTGYDVIVDLHASLRSGWLTRFPGRPPLLRIKKNKILRHLLVNYKINLYRKFYERPLSVAEKYLQAVAPLGVNVRDTRLELHLSREAGETAAARWAELSRRGFYVVMAPGARHFTKRWLPEYYAELIRRLHGESGRATVLVGGPEEAATCEQIRHTTGSEITEVLAGRLSLTETLALIRQAALFVSNDSGLMHAAAAFGVPQIAIFGSTTGELGFFPLNPNATVVENAGLSCRPCSHIGKAACPRGHFKCMREVTPEMVLRVAVKRISPPAS